MLPAGGRGTTYRYIGAEASATGDGWESLGDMGYLDEDGYLYLVDRKTDMILCGGANVYPAEIEGAIDAHPAVRSSAVVGLPDDDLGSCVHAIVDAPGGVADDGAARLARRAPRPLQDPAQLRARRRAAARRRRQGAPLGAPRGAPPGPGAVIEEHARRDPAGLALDDGLRRRSWAELFDRATRGARLFRDGLGLREGDHAALLLGNRAEAVELVHAAILAGIWLTPVNTHLTPEEVAYVLADSGAKAADRGRRARGSRGGIAGRRAAPRRRRAGARPRGRLRRAAPHDGPRRRHDALHERHHRAPEGREAPPRRESRRGARRPGALRPLHRAGRLGAPSRQRAALPRSAPHVRGLRPAVRRARRRDAALRGARAAAPRRRARHRPHPPRPHHVRAPAPAAGRGARPLRSAPPPHGPPRRGADRPRGEAAHDRVVGPGARRVLGRQRGRRHHPRRLEGVADPPRHRRPRAAPLRGVRRRRRRASPAAGERRAPLQPPPRRGAPVRVPRREREDRGRVPPGRSPRLHARRRRLRRRRAASCSSRTASRT